MSSFRRSVHHAMQVFRGLSLRRRVGVLVCVVLALGGVTALALRGNGASYVALHSGSLSARELAEMRDSLREAGLTAFEVRDGQILVPAERLDQYRNALAANGAEEQADWGSQLQNLRERAGLFSTSQDATTRREIALAKRICRMLRDLPEIAEADFVPARSNRRTFVRNAAEVTATVIVVPEEGRQLTPGLIESIRVAVAGMVPDLEPENVTVFDQSTGIAHSADGPGAEVARLQAWLDNQRRAYRSRLAAALSFIRDAQVYVHLDAAQVDPDRPLPLPGAVHVAVTVPDEYLRARMREHTPERGVNGGHSPGAGGGPLEAVGLQAEIAALRAKIDEEIRRVVLGELPAESPPSVVSVTFAEAPESLPGRRRRAAVASPLQQGRWMGLAGFGLVVMWLLWSRRGSSNHEDRSPADEAPGDGGAAEMVRENANGEQGNKRKERLMPQTAEMVRENANGEQGYEQPRPRSGVTGQKSEVRLSTLNPQLSALNFDHLAKVELHRLRELLEAINIETWAVALKGASRELSQRIQTLLPPFEAATLAESIERIGPVRLGEVESAQRQIVESLTS